SYEGRLKLLASKPEAYEAKLREASSREDRQFRKTKAAMKWDLVRRLDKVRSAWLNRAVASSGEKRREIGNRAVTLFRVLETIKAVLKPKQDLETRTPKQSKRLSLRGKPSDLDHAVAAKLSINAVPAGLVLMLTGARPKEIETGILVKIVNGNELAFEIQGAKVTANSGHLQRYPTLSAADRPLAKQLLEIVRANKGEMVIKRKRRRLHKDIQAAAKAAGFAGISPYSFRHLFASDLKVEMKERGDLTPDQKKVVIAQYLGHRTTATQSGYGTSQQGRRGALALLGVRTSGAVKITHRPYPNGPGGISAISKKLLAKLRKSQDSPAPSTTSPDEMSFRP
ncbi:MAG: hypothetical protein WBA73_15445, partial [Devosia sp.]